MHINITFDNTSDSIDLIKLSALYYDKVNVFCPIVLKSSISGGNEIVGEFYSRQIIKKIEPLIEQGIVLIKHYDFINGLDEAPSDITELLMDSFFKEIGVCRPIGKPPDIEYMKKGNIKDEKIIEGYNNLLINGFNILNLFEGYNENDEEVSCHRLGLFMFIFSQIFTGYASIINRRNIISNNDMVINCLDAINRKYSKNTKKASFELITRKAIPIILPNFYLMNTEEILNLRTYAKDELEEMRHYVDLLSSEYSPDDTKLENPEIFIKNKITPSIKQLEKMVYGLRVGTIQKALQNLKNPLSYTPLLTKFFTDIPSYISLSVSMGLIAAETVMEYIKQKKEISTNPLYFSVKLRRKIKNKKTNITSPNKR